jgi:hypothetical protein
MKLATHIQAEKGKEIVKTANEFIYQRFTVNKETIGEIELNLFNDTDCTDDEWLLKYRRHEDDDWTILTQGNIKRV